MGKTTLANVITNVGFTDLPKIAFTFVMGQSLRRVLL